MCPVVCPTIVGFDDDPAGETARVPNGLHGLPAQVHHGCRTRSS